MLNESDWTINGKPKVQGDPGCQVIMVDANACATCPLAEKEPEEPPSPFLQHLVYIAGLQEAGAQFLFSDLTVEEWEGLRLLKRKQNEKQLRDLTQRGRSGI